MNILKNIVFNVTIVSTLSLNLLGAASSGPMFSALVVPVVYRGIDQF